MLLIPEKKKGDDITSVQLSDITSLIKIKHNYLEKSLELKKFIENIKRLMIDDKSRQPSPCISCQGAPGMDRTGNRFR